MEGANLSGADLSCWVFEYAPETREDLFVRHFWTNLAKADLSGADLSGANLEEANLEEADLSRASLSRAKLHSANLRGVDLSRAILLGADLEGAKFLEGAKANEDTVWPEGFDPVAAGVIFD